MNGAAAPLPAPGPGPGTQHSEPGKVLRFGGGGPGAPGAPGPGADAAARLGIWLFIAPLAMFFLSIVSAYLVRSGIAGGFGSFPLPRIVWFNTAVLLTSGAAAETARRTSRGARRWLAAALLLGLVFLAGQLAAWRQLMTQGIGVGTTPFGSYFYLMTGAHALHLLGGLIALTAAAAWPAAGPAADRRGRVVPGAVIYWHFMNAVWIGLLFLLAYWR